MFCVNCGGKTLNLIAHVLEAFSSAWISKFCCVRIFAQAVGSIWFAPCWHGTAPLLCSLKMPTKHCWRLCKTSSSVSCPHGARSYFFPRMQICQCLSVKLFCVERIEPTNRCCTIWGMSLQLGKFARIRKDNLWFLDNFHCLSRYFICSTHHGWRPQIILENIIVVLRAHVRMPFFFPKFSEVVSCVKPC